MSATVQQVAEELEKLGYGWQIIPPERTGMTACLNVYASGGRLPVATVWPPTQREPLWVWGHSFEWHADGDASAAAVAARIRFTVPSPSVIATDREETEPCQRGTVGCCIDHDRDTNDSCETW